MYSEIQSAFAQLKQAILTFNQYWPLHVKRAVAFELPLLSEQKTPDMIAVSSLIDEQAVAATQQALLSFERDVGQAAGTVMRLPGVIELETSVLDQVKAINALKDKVKFEIERLRLELNLTVPMRSKLMRRALGSGFNANQLGRHIQCFDAVPRLVVFTWAGHTGGTEHKDVAQVREQLHLEAKSRANREGIAAEQTPEHWDIRALTQLADNQTLVKRKLVAPHPRAMFYLSESTRYDAMIHANLPAFVLAGDGPCEIRPLKTFDRANRTAERPDRVNPIEALPGRDLYLPRASAKPTEPKPLNVPSTYGKP